MNNHLNIYEGTLILDSDQIFIIFMRMLLLKTRTYNRLNDKENVQHTLHKTCDEDRIM